MFTSITRKARAALAIGAERTSTFLRGAKTSLLIRLGYSDRTRWADVSNLQPDWDDRTELLGSFVSPNSKVLEFGAGRMVLPRFLPPGCWYTPSDIVDRGPGTIVCDLNAPQLPDFPRQDEVVFSGVLEYVHDLPRLISHLATFCQSVNASYAVTDFTCQSSAAERRPNGWVNDYTSEQLQQIFHNCGFQCERMLVWREQHLFKFVLLPPNQKK